MPAAFVSSVSGISFTQIWSLPLFPCLHVQHSHTAPFDDELETLFVQEKLSDMPESNVEKLEIFGK
jgi:hypothetical protein